MGTGHMQFHTRWDLKAPLTHARWQPRSRKPYGRDHTRPICLGGHSQGQLPGYHRECLNTRAIRTSPSSLSTYALCPMSFRLRLYTISPTETAVIPVTRIPTHERFQSRDYVICRRALGRYLPKATRPAGTDLHTTLVHRFPTWSVRWPVIRIV